jgi:hypothetical protein
MKLYIIDLIHLKISQSWMEQFLVQILFTLCLNSELLGSPSPLNQMVKNPNKNNQSFS